MPTFKRAPQEINQMAKELIHQYHEDAADAGLRIDILLAYPDYDDADKAVNDAVTCHGMKALGLARIVNLKDRTKGLGDAEILLDAEHWESIDEDEQRAILDHEIHHFMVTDKRDNQGRPVLKLRKHDIQFGWFTVIAERHGKASIERKQASSILEVQGQFYFPNVVQGLTRMSGLELAEVALEHSHAHNLVEA